MPVVHPKSCRDIDQGGIVTDVISAVGIIILTPTPGHQIRVWCVNFEKIQKNIFIRHECNAASVLTR